MRDQSEQRSGCKRGLCVQDGAVPSRYQSEEHERDDGGEDAEGIRCIESEESRICDQRH